MSVFLHILHTPFPDQSFRLLFLTSIHKRYVNNRVYSISILCGLVTSTVSIGTILHSGRLRNRWSVPSRGKKYLSSQKYTGQFCAPPPVLKHSGYQGLIKLCIHLHLVSWLGMNGAIILSLHAWGPTPLWLLWQMVHLLYRYYAGHCTLPETYLMHIFQSFSGWC